MGFKVNYKSQFERLNEYQRAAVLDESNACLVNANVGSGKTTVLITKVIYLHYEKHIPYEQMVVLTFTNKAADEIKERLLALEPGIAEEQLWGFGTFHSVCLTMLKNMLPVERLGYTKDFMVMDPDEELEMAEQLILTYQLKVKYKNRLKKRLEQKTSKYQDDIDKLKALLKEEKRRQDKMTFDELLENTCNLLENKLDTAKSISDEHTELLNETESQEETAKQTNSAGLHNISWIIVDEVQDSDEKQLEFIDCLKQPETCLFAVGDPNQVIYSWRGSAFHIFYQLKTKYQATELSLPVNYRSSSEILAAAKCFMQNGGDLQGENGDGEKILIRNAYDSFGEAAYLAERIKQLYQSGIPYREIAVFYRLQSQSEIFEKAFEKEKIPFEVSVKKTVKDIPVLDWFIKLLRFSVNPKDASAAIAVLTNKTYGEKLSIKEAAAIVQKKTESAIGKNNSEAADSIADRKFPSAAEKDTNNTQISLVDKMTNFTQIFSAQKETTAQELWNYFSFESYLHPMSATFSEDKAFVMDFFERMIAYQKEQETDVVDGFSAFLNMASLYGTNILKKEIHNEKDTVKLMTLHASKGLEFSYVFITGMNNGLIPLSSKSFEEEEEEQRLFFVGITRAKKHLELSYYTNPGDYRAMPGQSRYLRMIPGHLVEGLEKDRRTSATHLQDLKREIMAEREKQKEETLKKVKHSKYGYGVIIEESDIMIKVLFDDYGEKEFMKMFCELEEIQ